MCDQIFSKKKSFKIHFMQGPLLYLMAILLGIFSGLSDFPMLHQCGHLISDIFIKIFKCISLPIIALSIIVTLSHYNTDFHMKSIWRKTILYTLTTTLLAAIVSALLYVIIQPQSVNFLSNHNSKILDPIHSGKNYFDYLINLIPTNVLSPFLEHQVLGVLLVALVIGTAIRGIADLDSRQTVIHFFRGLHNIFLIITKWVVMVIPIALYGFITITILGLRDNIDFEGIAAYLAIVVLANLIQGFVVLPLWLKSNHIKPFQAFKKMLPALTMAFFSKSSSGTLPITIETAEKNLHLDPKISRFVLPLCTTLNMNGCAAFITVTVLYIMQNHGIPITWDTVVIWIGIATIAAIGNAGIPMGCFFLSASLLASMDVPITLLGIILPFYNIIDMIETALNVWSDSCVAKVVDQKTKQGLIQDKAIVNTLGENEAMKNMNVTSI